MRSYKYTIAIILFSCLYSQDLTWNQEIVTFDSANPFSFEEIITNLDNEPIQQVSGILTLPEDFNPKLLRYMPRSMHTALHSVNAALKDANIQHSSNVGLSLIHISEPTRPY